MEKVLTEGEEVRYRVHVFTGNKLGASTTAIVRLSMIGEKGRTEDQVLDDSLHSIIKFQKNQVRNSSMCGMCIIICHYELLITKLSKHCSNKHLKKSFKHKHDLHFANILSRIMDIHVEKATF